MEKVDSDLKQTIVQIDAVEESLQNLINPGQSDIPKALDAYSKNVGKMDSLGENLWQQTSAIGIVRSEMA